MDEHELYILIELYLQGSLSAEEKTKLEQWLAASEKNRILFERLTGSQYLADEFQKLYSYSEEKGWKRIEEHLKKGVRNDPTAVPARKKGWPWLAAACLLGAILFGSIFFLRNRKLPQEKEATVVTKKDVAAPLETKAVIQLANGQIVSLDSIDQGTIAVQGSMKVMKTKQGGIVYSGTATEMLYNTVINPRGSRVVALALQDGSKVWLNSGSSLRYPVAFIGNERAVEVTGEAYFEVAGDPSKKFTATGNSIRTEVLGTHFNVNTYEDESETQVTLLEGKVKVSSGSSSGVLKPGQQAAFANSNGQMVVLSVNEDKVVAWRSGEFYFEEDDLPSVMRQLARWYDVDVQFKGKLYPDRYSGIISRDLSLLNVLKILKIAGVKYTLEGKRILIESNNEHQN